MGGRAFEQFKWRGECLAAIGADGWHGARLAGVRALRRVVLDEHGPARARRLLRDASAARHDDAYLRHAVDRLVVVRRHGEQVEHLPVVSGAGGGVEPVIALLG